MGLFGFGNRETVFWPGCFSLAKTGDVFDSYRKILKKIGITAHLSDYSACCSGILINAGYEKEARKLSRQNYEKFKKNKTSRIITSCALCHKTFSEDCKEMLPDWNVKIEHILQVILDKLKENPHLIKKTATQSISENQIIYYDSCYMARYLKMHDCPREILSLLGYSIVEMPYSKEEAICCGYCSGLEITNPILAKKISSNFLKQVSRTGCSKIVTADAKAYFFLKQIFEGTNIKIFEISDLICDSLQIWRLG